MGDVVGKSYVCSKIIFSITRLLILDFYHNGHKITNILCTFEGKISIMSKKYRQYIGIAVAVLMYYVVHEGAHLLVALAQGVFKRINFIGLGVQIDVFAEQLSSEQMGVFCLAGAVATLLAGWMLVVLTGKICAIKSGVVRACGWYTSLTLLMLDPIYLSIFYRWVGGGDMNGIALLLPEGVVSLIAAVVGIINAMLIWKLLYPAYTKSFADAQ